MSQVTYTQIAKMLDHSLLQQTLTDAELDEGCRLARAYDVASVCIKPYYVRRAAELLAGSTVVGWYGASTNIFGIVLSPAMILLTATFPELSRASRSLPDLRRVIDATGWVMFIAGAFTCSALYLFADHIDRKSVV